MNLQLAQQMLPYMLGWGGFSSPTGDDFFGGPGRSGRKGGGKVDELAPEPHYITSKSTYMPSIATGALQAAGFKAGEGNELIRQARRGILDFQPDMFRRGETQALSPAGWRPYYDQDPFDRLRMTRQLTPNELMLRGLAVRDALQQLQTKWQTKRTNRGSR